MCVCVCVCVCVRGGGGLKSISPRGGPGNITDEHTYVYTHRTGPLQTCHYSTQRTTYLKKTQNGKDIDS